MLTARAYSAVTNAVPPLGEVVSFTTLHSPPEGFRAPLHIALVELEGGARLFCHGAATEGVKIGSHVSVEAVDSVFYFSPSVSGSSSTANPGPSVAISKRMPFGSRK